MRFKFIAAFGAAAMLLPATLPAAHAQDRDNRDYNDRGNRDDRGYNDQNDRGDRDYRNRRDRNYSWQGDGNRRDWNPQDSYRSGNYQERRLGRNDRVYKGRDNRYYCKRNDGTTGLVIGAVGGGVLGNVVGGGTLGTLLGAGGGALLGRSIDRGNVKCR